MAYEGKREKRRKKASEKPIEANYELAHVPKYFSTGIDENRECIKEYISFSPCMKLFAKALYILWSINHEHLTHLFHFDFLHD